MVYAVLIPQKLSRFQERLILCLFLVCAFTSKQSVTLYTLGLDPVSQSDPCSVPLCLLSVCIIRCDVRDGAAEWVSHRLR